MGNKNRRDDTHWSATGAARFAREARTQAVVHLRRSPEARRWMRNQIEGGVAQGWLIHGSTELGMQSMLEPMGYAAPHRDTLDDYAERMCTDLARDMTDAELYVVSPAMSDVTVAAAYTLTLADIMGLRADDVPSHTGMLVLPRPLLIVNKTGLLNDVRGVAWAPMTVRRPGESPKYGIRVLTLLDTYGPVEEDGFTAMLTRARMAGDPFPSLMVSVVNGMPFGWEGVPTDAFLNQVRTAEQAIVDQHQRVAAQRGLNGAHIEGEHVSGSHIQDPDGAFLRRFVFAFWRLCEQRVTTVEKAPVAHAARAVANRIGATPDVSVVVLRQRRRLTDEEADSSHPVAWTSRWTVKMHKVMQWYPGEQTHKLLWRGPYIKGPEGLPLKKAPTVNALVR